MIDVLAVAFAISALGEPAGISTVALARLVAQEAECHEVDPALVVADAFRESGFDVAADSGVGDHGLMQVRRGRTTRGRRLTDRQLHDPATNVHLGVRRLAVARDDCPGATALRWLGGYAGLAGCLPSAYARRVLRARRRIRP